MNTIEYLFDSALAPLYWPGVLAAAAVCVALAPLSVLVVAKRMAFVGHGVSHSIFAGAGIALLAGAMGGTIVRDGIGFDLVILLSALVAASLIALLGATRRLSADASIGIVVAAAMALGFELHRRAGLVSASSTESPRWAVPPLESLLFGSILDTRFDVSLALQMVVLGGVVAVLWWMRRPLVFWAFDEPAAIARGVRSALMNAALLTALALGATVAVRLAGVVLAGAVLVLPGAAALAFSDRLSSALRWAALFGFAGAVLGSVVSFEFDLQPGPAVVGVLTLIYAVARIVAGRPSGSVSSAGGVGAASPGETP